MVGGLFHSSAPLPREIYPLPIVQDAGLTPAPVWTIAETVLPPGIRTSNAPARRHLLHRLSYSVCAMQPHVVYLCSSVTIKEQ